MTEKRPPASDGETDERTQEETLHSDQETRRTKPRGPFDAPSTYRYFRNSIVSTGTYGQLIWDVFRITATVTIIASVFFLLTGLTSPFVAVSSGSMEPHINTGDLVVIAAYSPDDPPPLAGNGEITTVRESRTQNTAYTSFSEPGDVIVFTREGGGTPVIHRAHFWVEEGENWVTDADPAYLGDVESCAEIQTCPAPNDGYITAGDNNGVYDQVRADYTPVQKPRIIGIAQYRVPWLGWIRIGIEAFLPV